MRIAEKTREQLTGEVEALRLRIAELEELKAERRQVEDELKQRAQILDSATDSIFVHDSDDNFVYANEAACRTHGYSRKEFMKMKLPQIVAPERARGLGSDRQELLEKGHIVVESAHLRKDGSIVPVEVHARTIETGGGKLFLTVARDITERKQAEEALQVERNKLQSVIDAMEYGLTIQDRDYNIIYQNGPLKTFFGDHLGEKCYRVYEGRDKVCDDCPVKKVFRDGKSHSIERRVINRSGEVEFREYMANPVRDARGQIVSCLEVTKNITERKQAEEKLRESEEKYRTIFENVSDVVVRLDKRGKIIDANKRIEDHFGYKPDEIIGKNFIKLGVLSLKDLPKIVKHFSAGVRGKPFPSIELEVKRKDGSTAHLEANTTLVKKNGKIEGTVAIIRDITERKKVEEALREAEEKYKNFVEATSDLVWESDEKGMFTFVSPKIKDILGYEADEVVGKKRTLDFAPEADKRKWLGRFKEVNAKRAPFSGFELNHIHKNGNPMVFEVSGAPFTDSAGHFKGYVGINKDITERKQAEEALKESQKFSSGLLENSPNPIFVVNPDTSVKYANPAFEKLTGFTLAEITGREAPYPWWPKERWKEITASFKNDMVTGGRRSERVFRKKNGERFFVMINSAPVVHRGKLLYFLVSWLDITERKQAEEERGDLEQKAHLASRLASVGEMASGIAHEINNPLTAVIGFAQLLMDTDLPDEVKEDISVIHKEAQRAAGVARNLLTFARKHTPTKQPTNLNSIIEGVLKLRAYEQSVSNIKVNTRFALNLPEVMTDYSQMQQVFINIILNAETAMLETGNGGTLTITTQKVNNLVRASFADSGPGITKENLNRIFDPFFTTKEVGKGTGLGLSVCHGIVAEHGGRIYARSRLGKGATFIVELPINAH